MSIRSWLSNIKFAPVLGIALSAASAAHAAPPARCFDFDKPPLESLAPRPAPGSVHSGALRGVPRAPAKDTYWAAARREIAAPLPRLLQDLLAHRSTKSGQVAKFGITPLPGPDGKAYLAHQLAEFEIDPFPFIHVNWTEEWSFAITDGTAADPRKVVVSYEKIDGTSYIPHLCGSLVLERKSPTLTDVSVYEEAKAHGRDEEEMRQGTQATLDTLAKNVSQSSSRN